MNISRPTFEGSVPVRLPSDPSIVVGTLRQCNDKTVFYSRRNKAEHRYRKYDGYGLSESLIERLFGTVADVYIDETDTDTLYQFTLSSFYRDGIPIEDMEDDPQRIVPVDWAYYTWNL
jgi:hypothetical protein